MKLFKTTIVILSEYNPDVVGLSYDDLVTDAMEGESYYLGSTVEEINCEDLEGEGVQEFFNCLGEEG